MSAMLKVVLAPRRLSGNRPKQPRNDPSRDSSGRMRTRNPISGWLRIPYFNLKRKFTLRVALWTHRRYRERDSIALRTAVLCRTGVAGRLNLAGGVGPSRVAWHPCLLAAGRPGTGTTVMGLRPLATRMAAPT